MYKLKVLPKGVLRLLFGPKSEEGSKTRVEKHDNLHKSCHYANKKTNSVV
jgi:hypothetical protein